MIEVKKTIYLIAALCPFSEGGYTTNIVSYDPELIENNNDIILKSMEVTMSSDININDLNQGLIDSMREEQIRIKAKAEVQVQNIEQQIQERLCLSHDIE